MSKRKLLHASQADAEKAIDTLTHFVKAKRTESDNARTKRRIFICVRCESIYADVCITECDCALGAIEFIEGVAEYIKP